MATGSWPTRPLAANAGLLTRLCAICGLLTVVNHIWWSLATYGRELLSRRECAAWDHLELI